MNTTTRLNTGKIVILLIWSSLCQRMFFSSSMFHLLCFRLLCLHLRQSVQPPNRLRKGIHVNESLDWRNWPCFYCHYQFDVPELHDFYYYFNQLLWFFMAWNYGKLLDARWVIPFLRTFLRLSFPHFNFLTRGRPKWGVGLW